MRPYLLISAIVAIFGGFLFGFQFVVASGITEFIKPLFHPSEFMLATIVSSVFLGAVAGCTFAGSMADKSGRKYAMVLSAILFILTPVGAAISNSVLSLVTFRILSGIALGIISTVSPMYLSEVVPAAKRGQFVSFYQLAIVSGILMATVTNYLFSGMEHNWRLMLGFGLVPGLIMLAGLMMIPESPKWLVKNNRQGDAEKALAKMFDETSAKNEFALLKQSGAESGEKISMSVLFKGKTGKVVLFGILLAVFQQLTGIAAVMSYAPDIMKAIGMGGDALQQAILVGFINFIFTFVAITMVDRLGRKTLMIGGLAVIIAGLTGLTVLYAIENSPAILKLISILTFVAGFSATVGPVMWVLVAEILPLKVKGPATSVATFSLWTFTLLVSFFFPIMLSALGASMSFGIYAVLSVIHLLFIKIFIPETKGKTLEEIEQLMLK